MNPVGSIHLFPPLRIAICLIAGIILGDVLMPSPWLPIAGFCLLLLLSAACFRHTYWQGAAVMLASVFFGCTLVTIDKESLGVPASVGQTVAYRAVLLSEPVERGKVIRCDLMVTTGEWSGKKLKASILRDTVDSHYKHLHVNDGIQASSVIERPVNYHDSNFNYVRYLESHGFVGTTFIYWSDWQKTAADLAPLSLFERARLMLLRVRQQLISTAGSLGLNGQNMAVAMAMTLGDKSMLAEMTRDVYAVSGASHVLALSGLHLSIIYVLLSFLVGAGRRHVLRELFLLAAIWAYVIMVGMPASVVRAAIMITVYGVIGLLHRRPMSLSTLSLAVIIMLVVHPLSLFDIGFQLSVLAVFSILVLYPMLMQLFSGKWLMEHRVFRWFWTMLCVSLSAQLGTAPLVCYYFERVACYGLLVNFLVIPLATVIIYLAVAVFVSFFLRIHFVSVFLSQALGGVASLLNRSLTAVSSWPGACIDHVHIRLPLLLLVYLLLAVLVFLLYRFVVSRLVKAEKNS